MKTLRYFAALLLLVAVLIASVSCQLPDLGNKTTKTQTVASTTTAGNVNDPTQVVTTSGGDPETVTTGETPISTTAGSQTVTTTAGSSVTTTDSSELPFDPLHEWTLTPLPKTSYYGYSYLAGSEKNEGYLWLYNAIESAINDAKSELSLDAAAYTFTADEVDNIFSCVNVDHPQFFWVDTQQPFGYSYVKETGKVTKVTFNYTVASADLTPMRNAFNDAVEKILFGIDALPNDLSREYAIHDRIVNKATYDTTYHAPMTHTAYGNLVNGTSVCDGYAKLFQYLLSVCGIQATVITGESHNENHAWNAVKLDGKYYFVDVTWDDPVGVGETLSHEYLNGSRTYFDADHTVGVDNPFPIPTATDDSLNYFTKKGYTADLTIESLAAVIAKQLSDGLGTDGCFEIRLSEPADSNAVHVFLMNNSSTFYPKMSQTIGKQVKGVSYITSSSGRVLSFEFNF